MENVARETFNGEVFVNCADKSFRWLEHYPIISVVWNCTAGGQRSEPRTAPATQTTIHGIMMNQGRASPALGAKTFGDHLDDTVEFFARQISIWPRRTNELKESVFIPILNGSRCNDLLGQHIQRFFRNGEAIELAAMDATQQRHAFHQFIAAQRKHAALRQTAAFVFCATDALQQRGDGARGTELADEINRPNIYAQLQRGRRHERS